MYKTQYFTTMCALSLCLPPNAFQLPHWTSFQTDRQYTNYFSLEKVFSKRTNSNGYAGCKEPHLSFTLAILSCILPFRSSPLALAWAAAALYFSSRCCNASSTVLGCCRDSANQTHNEMPHHKDVQTHRLPSPSPSLSSSENITGKFHYEHCCSKESSLTFTSITDPEQK